MIVSDWGAVHDTVAAAGSPLDIEMSVTNDFDAYCLADPLLQAVKEGKVQETEVDKKVKHILMLMLRLHMIDVCLPKAEEPDQAAVCRPADRKRGCYNTPEHRRSTLQVARESVVLLKNEKKLLPLRAKKVQKLLVIGDNANRMHAYGGGSAEIKALYEITPLMGLKCLLGGNCEITYVPGYYVPPKEETAQNWQADSLKDMAEEAAKKAEKQEKQIQKKQSKLREEALLLAKEYTHVIYVGGLNHEEDVEGHDRENMKLPYAQDKLLQQLLEVNPNTVVVMMAGNPVDMSAWINRAHTLLYMGYAGMEGGRALAEILFGKINPSGKLAETFPLDLAHSAVAKMGEFPGRALTDEEKKRMHATLTETYLDDIFVGYRYYDTLEKPVRFPFGYGLSYTTFSYHDMRLKRQKDQSIRISVSVTNTGKRKGKAVVQIYVGRKAAGREAAGREAAKQLKDFRKVTIKAGETKSVTMVLQERAFAFYDEKSSAWKIAEGTYRIGAGASCADIRAEAYVDFSEKLLP